MFLIYNPADFSYAYAKATKGSKYHYTGCSLDFAVFKTQQDAKRWANENLPEGHLSALVIKNDTNGDRVPVLDVPDVIEPKPLAELVSNVDPVGPFLIQDTQTGQHMELYAGRYGFTNCAADWLCFDTVEQAQVCALRNAPAVRLEDKTRLKIVSNSNRSKPIADVIPVPDEKTNGPETTDGVLPSTGADFTHEVAAG